MDCNRARMLLELALPRNTELDPAEAEVLDRHFANCSSCGTYAQAQRRLDAHLATAMQAVPIPPGLRSRIMDRVRGEPTVPLRSRRRWLAGVAAAAAVLFAVAWYLRPLPTANLLELHAELSPRRAAEAELFFAQRGVPTAVPGQFNYQLLAVCQLVKFQGHERVPFLAFHREGEWAEVYILSARHFDRAATLAQPRVDSGGWTVEVLEDPDNPQVFYLVKYSGNALQRFLTQGGHSA